MSGTARDVLQARDISGGVYFHAAPAAERIPAPRQLPAAPSSLVGRDAMLRHLLDLAEDRAVGVLVIAGTAGAGKTALAVSLAHRLAARFPDGQLFINFHGYDSGLPVSPAAALERMLRALGVTPATLPPDVEERAELYRTLVAGRRILILLDNAAVTGQVRPLLPGESECRVIVTSRSRLSGLAARDGARRVTVGLLSLDDAIELINGAADSYRDSDDPGQVAQLAELCACLPLALRIAAERAAARPLMPLRDLIDDLRRQSTLWNVLSSDDESEADAVRTVFAWSYRSLPSASARAFRLLGQHPGPDFGLGPAGALLDARDDRTRQLLDVLAGAHLLEQIGPTRYQFHDLLRAYAVDEATHGDALERKSALQRVTDWYLTVAYAAGCLVQAAPRGELDVLAVPTHLGEVRFADTRQATDWFRLERDNLLAIARTAAAEHFDVELWKLVLALEDLLDAVGAVDEKVEFGLLGLSAARRLGDRFAEAAMLQTLGYAYKAASDLEQAVSHHKRAREQHAELEGVAGVLEATNAIGLIYLRRRELAEAADCFGEVAQAAMAAGLRERAAYAFGNVARTRQRQGMSEEAIELAKRALAVIAEAEAAGAARLGPLSRLGPLVTLISAYREIGDLESAERTIVQTRERIASGHWHARIDVHLSLEEAELALARDDAERALEGYWQCAQIQRTLSDASLEADSFAGAARALSVLGRLAEAADFHRRAVAARRTQPDDGFRLAEAMTGLVEVLVALGERDEARELRAEALSLVEQFADPRATALRSRIAASGDHVD